MQGRGAAERERERETRAVENEGLESPRDTTRQAMDIESLERRNDASISALESKTALLKGITAGIHGEVGQQNQLLDELRRGMLGVGLGLGGTMTKIKRVMEGPRGAQYMYGMVGGMVLLMLFWRML
ncbi:MAG: hypothetical protein ABGY24_13280 [bacterium]